MFKRNNLSSWRVVAIPGRKMITAAIATSLVTIVLAHAQPADDQMLIRHVPGDGDVLSRRVEDIPPLVRNALGCKPAEHVLSELPIITFQPTPGSLPMTLVPCESIVLYSRALLFDHGFADPPSVMKFPQLLLIWNAKSKELSGYRFSDMIGTPYYVYREVYRHLGGTDLNGFALVARERGEFTKYGGKNWQPIEKAQPSDPRR